MPDLTAPDANTDLTAAIEAVQTEIDTAPLDTPDHTEAFRIRFLGRKSGAITDLFGQMGTVPPEARRALGQRLNALKAVCRDPARRGAGRANGHPRRYGHGPRPDAPRTHPAARRARQPAPAHADALGHPGHLPVVRLLRRARTRDRGRLAQLRRPQLPARPPGAGHAGHVLPGASAQPAAQAERGVVLRTHTSPVQVRVHGETPPPIRVIAPGRVFRNETISYKPRTRHVPPGRGARGGRGRHASPT